MPQGDRRVIEKADLRAAVGAGILSEAQAANLASLASHRRVAGEGLSPGDEPFEVFRGFNEIFIVVGLIILATGWSGFAGVVMVSGSGGLTTKLATMALIGGVLTWGLSEYFIRRRRMVAPAIALAVLWMMNASWGTIALLAQPFMVAQSDFTSLPLPLFLATLLMLVHWLRFRVPFSMAIIAVGLFVCAVVFASEQAGSPREVSDLFLLSAGGPFAWITLLLGLLVFAVAMAFDFSDRFRVTRRSANGFWLHIVAAPALVNTVALTLLAQDSGTANIGLAAVLCLFAVIAILIDRRSFLIAAAGYCVVLATTVFGGDGAATTIFALGLALLLLGSFWERIRARLISTFSGILPVDRLPPTV